MKRPEAVTAYPLAWPEGWPRTPEHVRQSGSRFRSGSVYEGYGEGRRYVGRKATTFDTARRMLRDELARLGATAPIISTDVPLRNDGEPRAGEIRRSTDPGVAVYFTYKGKPMVMAQDHFDSLAGNTRSLGLAIEALRQLERHGGGTMMERAFAGFSALPPPEGAKIKRAWWTVLNYSADPDDRADLSVEEVQARFRTLSKRRHPDGGGSVEAFQELQEARDDAVRDLGG